MQCNSSTNIVEFLLSDDLGFNQYLGISDIKGSINNEDILQNFNGSELGIESSVTQIYDGICKKLSLIKEEFSDTSNNDIPTQKKKQREGNSKEGRGSGDMQYQEAVDKHSVKGKHKRYSSKLKKMIQLIVKQLNLKMGNITTQYNAVNSLFASLKMEFSYIYSETRDIKKLVNLHVQKTNSGLSLCAGMIKSAHQSHKKNFNELSHAKLSNLDLTEKVQALEQEKIQCEQHIKSLVNCSVSLRKRYNSLHKELSSIEMKHEQDLQHRINPESPEFESLVNMKVASHTDEIFKKYLSLKQALSLCEEEMTIKRREIESSLHLEQSKSEKLQLELSKSHEMLEERCSVLKKYKCERVKLESFIKVLSAKVKGLEVKLTNLRSGKDNDSKQLQKIQETLEGKISLIGQLEYQLSQLKEEKHEIQEELLKTKCVVNELRSVKSTLEEKLVRLASDHSAELENLRIQINIKGNETSELQKLLDEKADTLLIKTKVIEDQNSTISDLKSQIRTLESSVNNLTGELKVAQENSSETLRLQLQDQQDYCQRLLDENEYFYNRKEELKSQLQENKASQQKFKADNRKLQSCLEDLEVKFNEITATLSEKESIITKLQTNMTQLTEACQYLRQRCDSLQDTNAQLEVAMKTKSSASEKKVQDYGKLVKSLNDKLKQSDARYGVLLTKCNRLKKVIAERTENLVHSVDELDLN